MQFQGIQRTFNFTQTNYGHIDQVFPLLCPVREKDWLDGWEYTMIYSKSGFIEKDCVFSTPNPGQLDSIWQVTQYKPASYTIEFLKFTPNENIVRINIGLKPFSSHETKVQIAYQYTSLSVSQNLFILKELEKKFYMQMLWWEKAINHYLKTGEMLLRT